MAFKTIRFACGSVDAPWSTVWRIVSNKDNVYIGASEASMALMKVSLHEKNGVWVFAANSDTGIALKNGNRRAVQWTPPLERGGIKRGPSILIPWTELPPGPPLFKPKAIEWIPAPPPGQIVEFSTFIVQPDVSFPLDRGEYLLADQPMAPGTRVILTARILAQSDLFKDALLKKIDTESVVGSEFVGPVSPYVLWFTKSQCEIGHPVIVQFRARVTA